MRQLIAEVRDIFWPMLDKLTPSAIAQRSQALENDLAAIKALKVAKAEDAAVLLDEARRLVDAEKATRATLETRAGIFVAAIGALIPILIFASEALEPATRAPIPHALRITVSVFASVYLAGALWWAFQVFKVRLYYVVSTNDLVTVASLESIREGLLKELLNSVRKNRDEINSKVHAIRMTQWLLWRSALCFLLLLTVHLIPDAAFDYFTSSSEVHCEFII
ncbi:hypothetical protein [Castellaniella sp.]|uniref:hypothetical protein n=1 Tax=Castellaniella sp. TaxID=1955812 RepID=UPI002AFF54C4|nr:hypothetical protein [Castellaniella sp.]